MEDWVERLRGLARLEWPVEVVLLVGSLTEEEWDRLLELRLRGPVEGGWPPPRGAVRACLDRLDDER